MHPAKNISAGFGISGVSFEFRALIQEASGGRDLCLLSGISKRFHAGHDPCWRGRLSPRLKPGI